MGRRAGGRPLAAGPRQPQPYLGGAAAAGLSDGARGFPGIFCAKEGERYHGDECDEITTLLPPRRGAGAGAVHLTDNEPEGPLAQVVRVLGITHRHRGPAETETQALRVGRRNTSCTRRDLGT